MEFDDLMRLAAEVGASDIHIHVGSRPMMRVNEKLTPVEGSDKIMPAAAKEIIDRILNEEQRALFDDGYEVDLSYGVSGVGRFRVNAFLQRGSAGIVMRRINNDIPSFEELNLPPMTEYMTRFQRGLILVTGTAGSGKSTTLAAMIDRINEMRCCHIVTLEDPIEYLHRDKQSVITQREIGVDSKDYPHALKAVVRQDPDVILIGEMRDQETIQAAITAAETGHLVFSTLHTTTAPQTIERILEYFQPSMRPVIRQQLAFHMRGVISQRIMPRIDTTGLIPAVEIMAMNALVKKMILEGKLENLKSVIHHSANEGMQTFDQHLVALYQAGIISYEEGQMQSSNYDAWPMFVQGFFTDIVAGIMDL